VSIPEHSGPLDCAALETSKVLILAITAARGDALDDLWKPLLETEAFERYRNKRLANEKEQERPEPLPGISILFYDDVHPSADLHQFLYLKFEEFLRRKYRFIPPCLDWPALLGDHKM
jgi:hypothetical protein